MSTLSKILTQLIQQRGLSTAELARQTGVAQPVIYRLMTGTTENPQVLSLKPLADYFGISLDQLMGYKCLTRTEPLNQKTVHDMQNKLTTIKTIASSLMEFFPPLHTAYQKALEAHLVPADIPPELLPILKVNLDNLIKAADWIATGLKQNQPT